MHRDGSARCLACTDAADLVHRDGLPVFFGGDPPWDLEDRAWFAAHPQEWLWMRSPHPHEVAFILGREYAAQCLAASRRAGLTVAMKITRIGPDRFERWPGDMDFAEALRLCPRRDVVH